MSLASDKQVNGQIERPLDRAPGFGSVAQVVLYALVLAVVIRAFLFQPYRIPSSSMESTLLSGDYVFVSKFSYGYSHYALPFDLPLFGGRLFAHPPERGDVAVFRLPRDTSIDLIKRVIGLPGDKVQMKEGVLYLNGEAVRKQRVSDFVTKNEFGNDRRVARYRETLPGGISYDTLDLDPAAFGDNTPVYVVPEGHYFVLGDNRDNSQDSRIEGAVGFVPFENFVGRAEYIFFSLNEGEPGWAFWRWPWTVRTERLFTRL